MWIINRIVFLLKQDGLKDCVQLDGVCHVLLNCLFQIYYMDVRNIVCQDITYLYMYSTLTSYWEVMVVNDGHYIVNDFETSIYRTQSNDSTWLPNENYLERLMESSSKLLQTTLFASYQEEFQNGMKLLCIVWGLRSLDACLKNVKP